jgi:hypothetical protein
MARMRLAVKRSNTQAKAIRSCLPPAWSVTSNACLGCLPSTDSGREPCCGVISFRPRCPSLQALFSGLLEKDIPNCTRPSAALDTLPLSGAANHLDRICTAETRRTRLLHIDLAAKPSCGSWVQPCLRADVDWYVQASAACARSLCRIQQPLARPCHCCTAWCWLSQIARR